jgi:hypothetical protein
MQSNIVYNIILIILRIIEQRVLDTNTRKQVSQAATDV